MKTRRAVILTGIAAIALLQVGAGVAVSAPESHQTDYNTELFFVVPEVSVIYGDYWSFEMKAIGAWSNTEGPGLGIFAAVTGHSDYHPSVYAVSPYTFTWPNPTVAYVSTDPAAPPLGAGTYSIEGSSEGQSGDEYFHGHTTSPAHLTIAPAALGMEIRVVADPNNPDNAIVTARFTGDYADNYYASTDPAAGRAPSGTMSIALTDNNGKVATGHDVEFAADVTSLSTTFYWADAKPGASYVATAKFTPSGHTAQNFAITEATPFSYTAAASQRPVPTSTAAAAPPTEQLPDPGFGLPLWSVIVAAVVILGLAALTIIFIVKGVHLAPAAKESTDAA